MIGDIWAAARAALERVPADPPAAEALIRRARNLRGRRYLIGALSTGLVAAGVVLPLSLLTPLSEERERPSRPAAPRTSYEASGERLPLRSVPASWRIRVDNSDLVSIAAPKEWFFSDQPAGDGYTPRPVLAVGTWGFPTPWPHERCGVDSALLAIPPDGVLVWFDEVNSASLSKDFGPTPERFRLEEMWLSNNCGRTAHEAYSLEFIQAGRPFVAYVAIGDSVPDALRSDAENVLGSFRVDDPPYPPEPAGPVIEVAAGTAFGEAWTLSAYRAKSAPWEGNICYRIGGLGSACDDPDALSPSTGDPLGGIAISGETGPDGNRAVVHGIVSKGVAGVTLTLDDGRVFSVATLKSKAFPVAFYVIPFEGKAEQVISIEALDAEGKVLAELNPLEERRAAEERAIGG